MSARTPFSINPPCQAYVHDPNQDGPVGEQYCGCGWTKAAHGLMSVVCECDSYACSETVHVPRYIMLQRRRDQFLVASGHERASERSVSHGETWALVTE